MDAETSHWLPDIDISVAGEPGAFLNQMADIGRASGRFDVELRHHAVGTIGFDAVNFRVREKGVHRELGFQLLAHSDTPGRVAVEVRAQRWEADPPTHAVYCKAARSLTGTLLTILNRNNATRYRLRIERLGTGRFKISPHSKTLLDRFALLANSSSLHPLDWRRFYALVREGRQEIPEGQLRASLVESGFSKTAAQELAELYGHLWAFKRFR
ncbi:hypothetical protein GCM10009422_22380 [Brevundimonas kwangchunensis]|uniref:Uncharacterized protein n=1 Tax=Brevundimonas kwangchunensis TaxID=322163 RepID=A0ABN1H0C8_9CAUL